MSWTGTGLTLRTARSVVREWLEDEGLVHLEPDVSLIVTELLTNAAEAVGQTETLQLDVRRRDDDVLVAVSNQGGGFPLPSSMPPPDSERGRGLAIVSALSTSLEVRTSGCFVTVYAAVRI